MFDVGGITWCHTQIYLIRTGLEPFIQNFLCGIFMTRFLWARQRIFNLPHRLFALTALLFRHYFYRFTRRDLVKFNARPSINCNANNGYWNLAETNGWRQSGCALKQMIMFCGMVQIVEGAVLQHITCRVLLRTVHVNKIWNTP